MVCAVVLHHMQHILPVGARQADIISVSRNNWVE